MQTLILFKKEVINSDSVAGAFPAVITYELSDVSQEPHVQYLLGV